MERFSLTRISLIQNMWENKAMIKKNVVIWGTGIISSFITRLINDKIIRNLSIVCYVETNPSRVVFEGLKVFPAIELSKLEYAKVLVASTYVCEIKNWILENHIPASDICYVTEEKIAITYEDGWKINLENDNPQTWISFMKNVLFTNSMEFIESISEIGKDFSKYWLAKDLWRTENVSDLLTKNQVDMLESLFIPRLKPTDILCDMACAWGKYSEMLAKYVRHIDGIDYSEWQINEAIRNAKAKEITNIKYHTADAREYLFDKKYDAFVLMALLIYIPDDADVRNIIQKIYNSMHTGGILFAKDSLTQTKYSVYGYNLLNSYTGCYRNMSSYEKMYTDMGFEILEKRILADDFYTGVVEKPSVGYLMKKGE